MLVQRNLCFGSQSYGAADFNSFSLTDLSLICFSCVVFGQSLSNLFWNSREACITGVKKIDYLRGFLYLRAGISFWSMKCLMQ